MRLIDADALVREIEKKLHEGEYQVRWMRNGKTLTQGIVYGLDGARRIILKQPTAYDPDKVVEQLEERTTFLKECTKYGNKDAEQQEKSYATMMMYEVAYLVDDLLEIVKGGGVDGN